MRTLSKVLVFVLGGLALGQRCLAQEPQGPAATPRYYRLEFLVKELENDKVINARAYATTLSSNSRENAAIRAGSRIPYATSVLNTGNGAPVSKQYQMFDVGVNIDAKDARELANGNWAAFLDVDISSVIAAKEATAGEMPPVVRRSQWRSPIMIPLRKATTIFSSDDPSGNRKMQLDLTVTPIS